MIRTLVLALVLGLTVATAASAATARLDLTEAKGGAFPERAFVIGLPSARRGLHPSDVTVTENGEPVTDVSLVPAQSAARQAFGTVLLLDASESMSGEPIAAALDAARSFAARRAPNQQLAVVTFNDVSHVALPLTTSALEIRRALAVVPRIAYGTHLFDAVDQAESMLADAGVQAGSIVVLSDGADTGSVATASAVAARARANHLKLFAIGLRDAHFSGKTLVGLSRRGGGEYASAASTADLRALFDALGSRLAREYLLRYKSLAAPGVPVHVRVEVAGAGSASAEYRTPELHVTPPAPYRPSLASRVLGSWISMVLVALFVAAAFAALVVGLVRPRGSNLPTRMAEFVSVPGLQTRERRDTSTKQTPTWVDRVDLQLEIANIDMSASTLLTGTAAVTAVLALLLAVVLGSPWWGLLAFAVPYFVREWVERTLRRRRTQFAEQLPDSLQVIAAALRAGHSFAGALAVVVERGNDPMRSEMQTVVADEQRGVPLEDAIAVVVDRMQNRDLEQVGLVARLQRDSGGNAAEVVDRVAETIRERFELRRLVRTLTVQGRMSRWIVTALPVALVCLLLLVNPHYLHPLVSSLGGKVLIGFGAALVVSGSLVIKRIVDIEV